MPSFASIAKAGVAGCCSIYLIVFGGTLLLPGIVMIQEESETWPEQARTTRNWGIGFFVVAGIVIFSGAALLIYVWANLRNQPSTIGAQTRPGVVFQTQVAQPLNSSQYPQSYYPGQPGTGQPSPGFCSAPPGTGQPPPGSYPVPPGTWQSPQGSYLTPPGAQIYPSSSGGSTYPSNYPTEGVTKPPTHVGYSTQGPLQQQQQYYSPPPSQGPGSSNTNYLNPLTNMGFQFMYI